MRFADVLEELEGLSGLRVQRSHWVNQTAIESAHKAGGKITLTLKNGSTVPVSRSYLADVRKAGLIK